MKTLTFLSHTYEKLITSIQKLDFITLILLRLYLAPIFIIAGWNKVTNFDSMVSWFGNAEWGLGLPMPVLMVSLVIFAELVGGIALVFGLFTRFFAMILSIAMVVAIKTVHWKNGWFAITPTDPTTSPASLLANLGLSIGEVSVENSLEASQRLNKARELLQNNGNYEWLTDTGNFVILNNGMEFGVTYLIMLTVLLVYGGGRSVSLDCLLKKLVLK